MRVTYAFDPTLDSVFADKVQVQQVVLNLVRNAIEAMEQSYHRDLMIGTERGADGMAIVKIVDTGTGISPEIADQLFQPFITTKSQGLGVGLSISRTIVESHGGRIWVEPNPAGGTTFRFHPSRGEQGGCSRWRLMRSFTRSMTMKRCEIRSNFFFALLGSWREPMIRIGVPERTADDRLRMHHHRRADAGNQRDRSRTPPGRDAHRNSRDCHYRPRRCTPCRGGHEVWRRRLPRKAVCG